MPAGRNDAVRAWLEERSAGRFRKAALHLRGARADEVARKPTADEDDEAVDAPDPVAAVGERVDAHLDLFSLANWRGHGPRVAASMVRFAALGGAP